jgi:hypothetical protein
MHLVHLTYEEVHLVLTRRITIGIEIPTGVIATREHSETNLRDTVVLIRASLCSSDGTLVVRSAHIKLVKICLVG